MSKENYIDASTGHITQHDAELMNAGEDLPFRYSTHEHGYIIFINHEIIQSALEDCLISDDFMELYLHAKDCKCNLINLDSDGNKLGILHLNDW